MIIYEIIENEINKTKSILKLTAAVGLIVGLVNLRIEDLNKKIYLLIGSLISHK